SIIVGTIGHDGGQLVGFSPGADQVIGRSLAGGVWRVWCIGRLFGEKPLGPERAVDLVSRDVQKSERGGPLRLKLAPIAQRLLKQRECSDHIGLNEFPRTVD